MNTRLMKLNWTIIGGDILLLACAYLAMRHWGDEHWVSQFLWHFMMIFQLIKQTERHYLLYRDTKKWY